jgi:toxin ParE1/3/4
MRLGFAPAARQDLRDIGDYISRDSRKAARTYVAKLREQCVKAALNPVGYPMVSHGSLTLKRAIFGAYNIYFSVRTDEVRVERVIHGANDPAPGEL